MAPIGGARLARCSILQRVFRDGLLERSDASSRRSSGGKRDGEALSARRDRRLSSRALTPRRRLSEGQAAPSPWRWFFNGMTATRPWR
jgi:hypothetical protein